MPHEQRQSCIEAANTPTGAINKTHAPRPAARYWGFPKSPLFPLALVLAPSLMFIAGCSRSEAREPGRGITSNTEQQYLKFIIDHHYSALRMTELAAGTDTGRSQEIGPAEGVAPSPEFAATPAKAQLAPIKSLARRENQVQREEILSALDLLQKNYGMQYTPQIPSSARSAIQTLEAAAPGEAFDRAFLKGFSMHHFLAVEQSQRCLAGREANHQPLRRYCQGIVDGQTLQIEEMRELLCEVYAECDFQPQRTEQ